MDISSDAPVSQRDSSGRGFAVVFLVVGTLVVYILSPAMVMRMYPGGPPGHMQATLETVYAPLQWGYDNVPWVESFYDTYFAFVGI